MNPHSNTQSKAQVDAEVLSKRSLPRHYLGHRPQTKHLHTERRGQAQAKTQKTQKEQQG